jgi:hypothetical protein
LAGANASIRRRHRAEDLATREALWARPGLAPVFVAETGEHLRISVPDRYDGEAVSLFQWLDDDRFALVMSNAGVGTLPIGDLLACGIPAGQCPPSPPASRIGVAWQRRRHPLTQEERHAPTGT